jgi:Holliday junction DNA helicase RuvA
MIARLRGEVIEHEDSRVIVDCAGVGYGVQVCYDEQQQLTLGTKCDLYIAEQIKEDAHDLYGFSSKSRKQLFGLLISVNGVGPKAGMAILNIGTELQVRSAIASSESAIDFLNDVATGDEAVEALTSLGYGVQDAVELLRGIDSSLPTSDRIKLALKSRK